MLNFPAKLTHDDAGELARSLKSQIPAQAGSVVVEAKQLLEFDSSALAVLLACRREALAAGKQFSTSHLPVKLVQLATLYGVVQLLGSNDSSKTA
jgi:phospholipid transport system transporter-binding protein